MSHDNYYTQSVALLGDTRRIVAVQDICTDKGIKLIARGGRIHSGMLQQLLHHKLIPMLDQALTIEGALDQQQISHDLETLLRGNPLLSQMVEQLPHSQRPCAVALRIALVPAMAFKLTVAKEQRSDIYLHSLLLLAIASYLGGRAGLGDTDLITLATAALFHDIGLLHIDPTLLTNYNALSEGERRNITAHPAIAWLLLKEFPEYAGETARAVLEHHERLDGSGYPKQLQSTQLGRFGQMLAVAEVVASRFDSKGLCHTCHTLEIILKLNSGKLNPEMVVLLSPLLGAMPYTPPPGSVSDNTALAAALDGLGQLFLQWDRLNHKRKHAPIRIAMINLYEEYDTRIQQLRTTLRDTGFDPQHGEAFIAGADEDHHYLSDVTAILKEAQWQFREILRDLKQRYVQVAEENEEEDLQEWMAELGRFVDGDLR